MRLQRSIGLMVAFVVGCVAAAGIPRLLQTAHAQPAAPGRPQWDQMCIPLKDEASGVEYAKHPYFHAVNLPTGWNKVLAAQGAQGWELVAVLQVQGGIAGVCFKRPH